MGNASEKLQKLIADGAAYGIHFIICSSDYQTVKESMHFGMNILNKFRERIVFALSDSDAFNQELFAAEKRRHPRSTWN